MMKLTSLTRNAALAVTTSLGLALFTGCGLGTMTTVTPDTAVKAFSGTLHGGPNPVVGARVILYSTTSNGYGAAATQLQEATQVGAVAHQDTDVNGSFSFTGGFNCPAGQYAYVVSYGGNTGANANNPNSILMAALGSCASLYTGTTYTGSNIWINEATTTAAAYALSNFLTVAGDAVNGFTVNVGAPATNNSGTGCVANAYYSGCTATAAPGLKSAFSNATSLVSNSTGVVNATTTNGAVIPVVFLNSLANILQTCVNSTGGGTNGTGTPSTTITAAGTSHDGTNCGRLFAYTSYTADGTVTGALTTAGNLVSAVQNLAKRPTSTRSTFNSTCDSNSGSGTTTAAQCLFNLQTANGFYTPQLTLAPTDWLLGISYPKGSFSAGANTTTGCSTTPATLGTLYPFMLATDISNNVVILNGDQSTATCYNTIAVATDGTTLSANQFDNSAGATPIWISTDAFGHAIVPVKSTTVATEDGIHVYAYPDSGFPLVANLAGSATTANNFPFYTGVDQNDSIFVTSQPATNTTVSNYGYIPVSGAESHTLPTYGTPVTFTANSTSKLNVIGIDIKGNAFTTTSSSSGSSNTRAVATGGSVTQSVGSLTGSTSNGITTVADTLGNVWNVQNMQGTFTNPTVSTGVLVFKQTYSVTGTTMTLGTPTQVTTLTPGATKPQGGQIDGNNVIWYVDLSGSASAGPPVVYGTGHLHGYETVTNYDTHAYYGCKFGSTTPTTCGSQPSDANYPQNAPNLFYGTRALAIDSAGSIWVVNGTLGTVTQVIGTAAPTWPLFIHNGTSNKP